jgi:hypothetical protein
MSLSLSCANLFELFVGTVGRGSVAGIAVVEDNDIGFDATLAAATYE